MGVQPTHPAGLELSRFNFCNFKRYSWVLSVSNQKQHTKESLDHSTASLFTTKPHELKNTLRDSTLALKQQVLPQADTKSANPKEKN